MCLSYKLSKCFHTQHHLLAWHHVTVFFFTPMPYKTLCEEDYFKSQHTFLVCGWCPEVLQTGGPHRRGLEPTLDTNQGFP